MCDITQIHVQYQLQCGHPLSYVTWIIHTCDMNQSNVCHDSFICVIWPIYMCDITGVYMQYIYMYIYIYICIYVYVKSRCWHPPPCVTRLIHTCNMTQSYVRHDLYMYVYNLDAYTYHPAWQDSFIRATWLIHMRDMTYMCVQHKSQCLHPPPCVTRLIHTCDVTHSCVWHDPFTCVTWSICDTTYLYVWHHAYMRVIKPAMLYIVYVAWPSICVTWHISYVWHE